MSNLESRLPETDLSPLEYYRIVAQLNVLFQSKLKDEIEKGHNSYRDLKIVGLYTTGSDARLEKMAPELSPLEVISVSNAEVDPEHVQQELQSLLSGLTNAKLHVVETKTPTTPLATFNFKGLERLYPARIMDARRLFGKVSGLLRDGLWEEVRGMNGKDMSNIGSIRRVARGATERGTNSFGGKEVMHYDIQKGIVFYNPAGNQFSFKIGPLRFVQSALMMEMAKHVRRDGVSGFLRELQRGIVPRLEQIQDDRMTNLSRESTRELGEIYAFFLKMYHRSKSRYVTSDGKEVAIQLDQTEMDEVARRMVALKKILNDFEIKKQPVS